MAAVVHVALPLSLQSTHGTTLTFGFDPSSDTVSGLKAKIEVQTGLGCGRAVAQLCCHVACTRRPATRCSARFGVVAGSTVYL